MTQQPRIDQEQANRLSARLQTFYDALPADEQLLMRAILTRARGDDDVSGHVMPGGCIIRFPFPMVPFPPNTPPTFPTDPFAGGSGVSIQVLF